MEHDRNPIRDNFIRQLSNYSLCIEPYLRNIQEKYVTAMYPTLGEDLDLAKYCKTEFDAAMKAKKAMEDSH